MVHLVFSAVPALAVGGQIAAIVIGLYALIFILVALVFNLVMAIAMNWLHQKVGIIKRLRPTVESVNKTSELVIAGEPVPQNTNNIIKAVAQVPGQVRELDHKVDEGTDKAMKAVIEFRARTMQVQAVAKAFVSPFFPKLHLVEPLPAVPAPESQALDIKSPGYNILMSEKTPDVPVISSEEIASSTDQKVPTSVEPNPQSTPASMQYNDVPSRR
ncbi:MAG TPA: hypothetical protein DHW02_24890 [Ktedonobacter sp.]|jgi:hypothetical protein|nr:hypothetical protein [Ktedonobacter sp.]